MTPSKPPHKFTHLIWCTALILIPVILKAIDLLDWTWWIVLIPYDLFALFILFVVGFYAFYTIYGESQIEDAFEEMLNAKSGEERELARERWEMLKDKYDTKKV